MERAGSRPGALRPAGSGGAGGGAARVDGAPNPEAIRETARNNNLPIDSITEVSVLDPYFYRG